MSSTDVSTAASTAAPDTGDDRHGARGGDDARLRRRSGKELLPEPRMAAGHRLRPRRRRPGGAVHAAALGVLDPVRQGPHHGRAGVRRAPGPRGHGHRRRAGGSHQPRRRRQRAFHRGGRGLRARPGPGAPRTSRTPRSATRTATAGCSRRSRAGSPAGSGRTDMDVAARAELLRETSERHGAFEAIAPPHDWWDWYAAYMDARQGGSPRMRPPRPPTATWRRSRTWPSQDEESAMSTVDASPSNNGRGSDAWSRSWTHFSVDRRSPGYCRVTFDHPPINTITATTVAELAELVGLIEQDPDLNVVVFDSANPDFYLAHYDTEHDPGRTAALRRRPDRDARVARSPRAPVACAGGQHRLDPRTRPRRRKRVRARLRPAVRLARERAARPVRGRNRCGPRRRSDGPAPRLVGRGRALEILLVADDLDGPRAEQYGYVNRAIADDRLDDEVEEIAVATRALRPRRDRAHEVLRRPGDAARRQRVPARPGRFLRDARAASRSRSSSPGSRRSGSTPTATSSGRSGGASSSRLPDA